MYHIKHVYNNIKQIHNNIFKNIHHNFNINLLKYLKLNILDKPNIYNKFIKNIIKKKELLNLIKQNGEI